MATKAERLAALKISQNEDGVDVIDGKLVAHIVLTDEGIVVDLQNRRGVTLASTYAFSSEA